MKWFLVKICLFYFWLMLFYFHEPWAFSFGFSCKDHTLRTNTALNVSVISQGTAEESLHGVQLYNI